MRSLAFWLKSTNTLSPRSSFHHRAVARPGARFSTSRASVSAASRTCLKSHCGAIRTRMCSPRDPLVFGQPTRPTSSSTSRATIATSTICDQSTPGIGSRSTRSSSGWSRSSARTGMRVQVEAPEVDDPGEAGGIPDHRLFGRRAAGVVQGRGVDEVGVVLGHALLEERLLVDALDEALEHHRAAPPRRAAHRRRRRGSTARRRASSARARGTRSCRGSRRAPRARRSRGSRRRSSKGSPAPRYRGLRRRPGVPQDVGPVLVHRARTLHARRAWPFGEPARERQGKVEPAREGRRGRVRRRGRTRRGSRRRTGRRWRRAGRRRRRR